jgi:hypothetical protein
MQARECFSRFQALWLQLKPMLVILYTYEYMGHADDLERVLGGY